MTGQGIAGGKSVQRDPKSGHIVIHPAYEGWRPTERPAFRVPLPSGFTWATVGQLAFWAAVLTVVRIGLDIPS